MPSFEHASASRITSLRRLFRSLFFLLPQRNGTSPLRQKPHHRRHQRKWRLIHRVVPGVLQQLDCGIRCKYEHKSPSASTCHRSASSPRPTFGGGASSCPSNTRATTHSTLIPARTIAHRSLLRRFSAQQVQTRQATAKSGRCLRFPANTVQPHATQLHRSAPRLSRPRKCRPC